MQVFKEQRISEERLTEGSSNNQPVKKFRAGSITAAIWGNKSKEGKTWNSVTFTRSYKDNTDSWKNTGNFRVSDLPKLNLVSQKAFEYLAMKQDTEDDQE